MASAVVVVVVVVARAAVVVVDDVLDDELLAVLRTIHGCCKTLSREMRSAGFRTSSCVSHRDKQSVSIWHCLLARLMEIPWRSNPVLHVKQSLAFGIELP
jgi:hypothetical protein